MIGDELLAGNVRDENLSYMIDTLEAIGYHVGEVRIVRDDHTAIAQAFAALQRRYEYVLSAGGVGPTHDDITLESAAEAFAVPAEVHPEMERFLVQRYGHPLTPMLLRMARVPLGTVVHGCERNQWPLMQWNNVFILPGLPRAMRDKMRRVAALLPPRARTITRVLYLNADESAFADWLNELQHRYPTITIGSYPVVDQPGYRTRLTLKSIESGALERAATEMQDYLRDHGWLVEENDAQ